MSLINRRDFLRLAAGFTLAGAAAGALVACGNSSTSESSSSETAGATDMRVVALNTGQLDNLLELGILPVGAAKAKDADVIPQFIRDRYGKDFDLDSIADCGLRQNPDLEAIAALEPTLICANSRTDEAILTQLRAIAEVVTGEGGGENWKQDLATIAQAVGKGDEAEAKLKEYEDDAKAWGATLASVPTVSFLRSKDQQYQLYGVNSMAGTVAADAGLKRPENQQNIEKAGLDLSPEQLSEADADWIFYGVQDGDADPSTASTWPSLNAVKNNHAVKVDYEAWYMNASLLSATIILDGLKGALS